MLHELRVTGNRLEDGYHIAARKDLRVLEKECMFGKPVEPGAGVRS